MAKPTFKEKYGPWICIGCGYAHPMEDACPTDKPEPATVKEETMAEPTVEQMLADLESAGWAKITSRVWKAPRGGYFLGPYGAWVAMKRRTTNG